MMKDKEGESLSPLLNLPQDLIYEITRHLSLKDLAHLQRTCSTFYNLILQDREFTYYNTVKFFELYYGCRLFALFLFPYIDPRYSYHGKARRHLMRTPPQTETSADDICPGNTCFHIAASNGLTSVIKDMLMKESALLVEKGVARLPTPHPASTTFNQEAIGKYIRLKPENQGPQVRLVELINDEPNTALHYISILPEAVDEEDVLRVARLLIRKGGVDLLKRGRAGNTVLCEAAQHGQLEMVRLLLDEYERQMETVADLPSLSDYMNLYNNYSENAVILAARTHPEVLRLLLERGASPDAERRGSSILHIVASRFRLDRRDPQFLEEYHRVRSERWRQQPEVSITDPLDDEEEEISTRLGKSDMSMFTGSPEHTFDAMTKSLQLLIRYGADVHRPQRGTGMTPLHIASLWGSFKAVELLIREGRVDPNEEVNEMNGWLPIHYACSEGQMLTIHALLANGAYIWGADDDEVEESDSDSNQSITTTQSTSSHDAMMQTISNYTVNLDLHANDTEMIETEFGDLMPVDGPSQPRISARSTHQHRRRRQNSSPDRLPSHMIHTSSRVNQPPAPLDLLTMDSIKTKLKSPCFQHCRRRQRPPSSMHRRRPHSAMVHARVSAGTAVPPTRRIHHRQTRSDITDHS